MIDKSLKIDKIISRGERGKFAITCIWSTSLPLFHEEYGLGQRKFYFFTMLNMKYGRVGHKVEGYLKKLTSMPKYDGDLVPKFDRVLTSSSKPQVSDEKEDDLYEPTIMVQK